jgi:hypothetical protein
MLLVAIICTVCGAAIGAVAVFSGISRRSSADAESAAPPPAALSTVGLARSSESTSAVTPRLESANSCREQTWPYLHDKCLAGSDPASAARDVRVLRPEQPAQSAPAMIIEAPSGREAVKAEADAAVAKNTAKAKEAAQKENRRRHARRVRQPANSDSYEADAAPYRERYEPRRSDWGWGW